MVKKIAEYSPAVVLFLWTVLVVCGATGVAATAVMLALFTLAMTFHIWHEARHRGHAR